MAQQKAVDPAADEVDDLIDELQPGAKLLKGQYTITRYLNSGGFGITYIAKDSLDRDVVIKECFPSSVCRRSKVMVAARSRAHTAELRSIVQLFVREARNLAKIVHPNIVSVHNVFEDNGTAYMALDYIDGLDLQQIIDGEGTRLTQAEIVEITGKLIKAVGFIHSNDMLHRDISPDNVLISKTGEPILIDFGAAREKASQTNRAMSALRVVKDGYSPQEFYIAGSEQGPWSDLYALGATLYHLISDEAPVNGQARLGALAEDRPDPYVPLTGRFQGYPNGFLEAIDRVLSTLPKQRLQSAAEWLAMYNADGSSPMPAPVTLSEPDPGTDDAVQRLVSDFQREAALTEGATHPAAPAPGNAAPRPGPVADATPAPRGKGSAKLLGGVAVALAVVAGAYVMLGGPPSATDPLKTEAAADAAATTEATPSKPTETAEETPVSPPVTAAGAIPALTPETTATDAKPAIGAAEEAATDTAAAASVAPASESAAADPDAATAGEPASEDTASSAPTEDTATAEAAVSEPAATEPTPAEPAATEPATTETAITEPAATEPAAAEPALALPVAPVGTPVANQIAFAAWDVVLPFMSDDRLANGTPIALITRIPPEVDLGVAGDWLAQGVAIHSVNGVPLESAGSITTAVLNAMQVDPDGKARVIVEYSSASQSLTSGLLTVSGVRLVSLQNGVTVRTLVVDGVWRTEVTGVTQPDKTGLRQGDILFRDRTTGTPLDSAEALETIMAALVERGITQTEFSIIRDNKVSTALMQLDLEAGQ
ncbi:MAG: protein kinase [Tabrizicola sp.]|jgi:hypothetical protein|nr:protein kinase [Tabrizicola sp.]